MMDSFDVIVLGAGTSRESIARNVAQAAAAGTLAHGDSEPSDAVAEYAQRFAARGRTPADERHDAWPNIGSALLAEDAERVTVMAR